MSTLLHSIVDPWAVQQDYVWFLAALAWICVLVGLVRSLPLWQGRRWLIALAVIQAVGALLEIAHFVTVPASIVTPWRGWEWFSWLLMAAQAGALAALLGARAAWVVGVTGLVAVGWQMAPTLTPGRELPVEGGLGLTLLLVLAAWAVLRKSRYAAMTGLVVCVAVGALCGANGALAEMAHEARRWSELSLFSLPAAFASLGGAIFGRAVAEERSVYATWWAPDRRRFHRRLGAWLAAGFVVALVSGSLARRTFEQSLLARAQAYALAIDVPTLETWLKKEFRLGERLPPGRTFSRQPVEKYRALAIDSPAIQPMRGFLRKINTLSPDVRYAHVTLIRQNDIVIALYPRAEHDPRGVVIRYAAATAKDYEMWSGRVPHVLPPYTGPRGSLIQARAPILGSSGAILGWFGLDTVVTRWVAAQAQARLLVNGALSLGVALLLLAEHHRRRTSEKELAERAMAVAKAADQAKSDFLAQVSHELRTPIQSILGYGELLRGSALTPRQRKWAEAQNTHSELLLRLVNDLLDHRALQTGAFQLTPQPGNVVGTVETAVESLREKAEAKGLSLSFESGSESETLDFDGARVRQVVHNLVSNAIKFTSDGSVRVKFSTQRGPEGMVQCTLSVADTGPGIPAEHQTRLFQPFVRLPGAQVQEGSGLGLAIARRICRTMTGDLTVTSDGKSGSVFVAMWNAPQSHAPAQRSPLPVQTGSLAGLRVLVADDNRLVRELFAESLEKQGGWVEVAINGEEALAKAAPGAFDIVVLDLSMPLIDGEEVARRLRQRDPAVRIIGVSAHANSDDYARAIAAGMNGFLPKPVSLSALFALMRPSAEFTARPAGGDFGALRERLYGDFVESCPQIVESFDVVWQMRDWPALARCAHHLKGSADVLGLDELSSACARLYAAAESRLAGPADEALTDIRRILARVVERPAPQSAHPFISSPL
ncbi:MAG: response regulator [Verrucomicrobia bacterium]|nr:response regulator [Verrucomicrobiota bacterium]